MGYTTDFYGRFELNKALDEETFQFLVKLANTRRMKRDVKKLVEMDMGTKEELGVEGEFFVGATGMKGQDRDSSIIDYNSPPSTQPGLWCDWEPTDDRQGIEWNGMEKFYNATEWIQYIVEKILEPRGYVLNGIVNAQGEERGDQWHIQIRNNVVQDLPGFHPEQEQPEIDDYEEYDDYEED